MNQDKSNAGNNEWEKADARVLGQILAAQNFLFTLPSNQRIAEFFTQALISIPGVSSCRICLGDVSVQIGEPIYKACLQCEDLRKSNKETNTFLPENKCELVGKQNIYSHAIRSGGHHFGFFTFHASTPNIFDVYWPFVGNLANYVALSLENRYQKDLLQKAHDQMEQKVVERTQKLESANVQLQKEIEIKQRTEKALRTSEERFRDLYENAPIAYFSIGVDGFIHECNRRAGELLGYTKEALIGRSVTGLYTNTAQGKEKAVRIFQRFKAGETVRDEELEMQKADGNLVWISLTVSDIRDAEGQIVESRSMVLDITERKKAEAALQEREKHSQSLLCLSRKLEQAQTNADVLNAAQGAVREIMGYQNLWVYLFTPDKRYAKAFFAKGPMSDMVMKGEGIATLTIEGDQMLEEIAAAKEIVVVEDARIDERTNKEIVAILGNRTIINIPIILFDKHFGSVGTGTFGDEGIHVPTESENKYLLALASHIAVTLDRIQLLDKRRQMEQELVTREREYRVLVENIPDLIVRYDTHLHRTYVNPAWEKASGLFTREVIDIPPAEIPRVANPINEAYLGKLQQVLATGIPQSVEFTWVNANAVTLFLDYVIVPEYDQNGKISGVLSVGRDITARRRAEEALRESEERYRTLVEQASDGIFVADAQGNYLDVNPSGCNMLGYTREEILKLNMRDLASSGSQAERPLQFDDLQAGKDLITERLLVTKSGAFLPVEISGKELDNGNLLGLVRDITERKQAEQALQRLNRQLRAISNCNQTLLRAEDEQTLLDDICRIVCGEAGYIMAWVGYKEEGENTQIVPVSWAGDERGYLTNAELFGDGTDQSPTGLALNSGQSVSVQDLMAVLHKSWRDEQALQRGYRSCLALPLLDENKKTFGVFTVYATTPGVFSSEEIQLLEELAGDLAFGITVLRARIKRRQAEDALYEREKHSQSLLRLSRRLEQAETYQDVLIAAQDEVKAIVGYQNLWVYLITEDKEYAHALFAGGPFEKIIMSETGTATLTIRGDKMLEEILTTKEIVIVEDAQTDERVNKEIVTWLQNRTILNIPILLSGKHLGSVGTGTFGDEGVLIPTPSEREYLIALASHMAVSIDRISLLEKRKETERQLLASEQLFRALVENSPDFIARYDREFRRIYVNPAIQKLFKTPVQTVLGRTPKEQSPIYAPQIYSEHLNQVIETATETSFEIPFRTAQGEMHWGHIRFVPEFDSEGRVETVLAIGRDIHEIKENEQRFRRLAENFPDFVMRFDRDNQCTYVNPAAEKAFGVPAETIIGKRLPEFSRHDDAAQNPTVISLIQRAFAEGIPNQSEARWKTQNGERIFEVRHAPEKDAAGNVVSVLSIARDVTEQKRIEQERLAHLHFLESLDQVNRVIQGTNHLEEMMRNVLDVILSVFDSDRAWLVYPCDPEAQKWQTPMERTRPEFPGVVPIGVELPLDPVGAEVFRILRAANHPVQFGPEGEHPVPDVMNQVFRVQSFIALALYPKVGLPWSFGLHQCTYARVWTLEEERLLQEIGRRVADALTGLLAYRNLRESERKLGEAERMAHVGYWIRDYVADVITLSDEACRIFGLPLREHQPYNLNQWHKEWLKLIHPEDQVRIVQAFEKALQDGPRYEVEYRVLRSSGVIRIVRSLGDVTRDEAGQPQRIFGTMQDITELRQAEHELRASEARFRVFVDHAADAFYLHDSQGKLVDVNRQACESLGYSRDELIGMTPYDFDAGIDPSFIGQIEKRLDAGEMIEFNTQHRRKDESVFPVEVRSRPFWQGEQRFSVSLARDITERKQTQEALTLFRALIEHATDIIEIAEPETGRFLDVNKQACLAHGYTREEFLTLTINQINPVTAARPWKETVDELQNFGSIVRESKHQRKDGSIFPVEINITYVRLDRDYIISVVRDITKRKQADEALRASEERYRALYHENPSMFFSLDDQGNIISLNDFGASQLGYTIEELEGKPVIDIFYEEDHGAMNEQFQACLHDPWQVYRWQFRKVRKDGSLMWVEEFARTVNGPDGDVHMQIVCQDISERKRVEQQIRKLNQELEERVAERTIQLEAANQELEAFAYSISHDLRAPLRHIGGFLELFRISTETTLDEQSLHYLATISDATRRMGLMIDALLSFSRTSRRKMSEVEVDLGILVQDVVHDFDLDIIGREIQWHLTTLPKIIGDPTLLRMVFENLISNALKFTKSRTPTKIEIGWLPGEEDEIVVFVRDNGVGFDMDYADKLFGVFQRLHRADEFEGTGIGLANVRRIIERHGGKTWAEAQPGVGATFYCSFPYPATR